MKTHHMERQVCYNVQSAEDIKHHLIFAHDIVMTTDRGQLTLVAEQVQETLDKKDIFNKSLFKYDKEKDMYMCPASEELPHQRDVTQRGLELKVYVNFYACRDCKMRDKCTTSSKEPRKMKRWAHGNEIDAMQQRLDDNPDIPVLRKQTIEHPFGTIKMWMGATHFLMKRKKNVSIVSIESIESIEMNLYVLAYNLKRMMTIMGTTGLMEAISQ
jgi:hypothetical protein